MGLKRPHDDDEGVELETPQRLSKGDQEKEEAGDEHGRTSDDEHDRSSDNDTGSSEASDNDTDSDGAGSDGGTSDSNSELGMVNIDFEFFDPSPEDFHAMKHMLVSAFGDDAEEFNVSELVELILEQNAIGSTVKVEEGGDPYGFMTVVDMRAHSGKTVVKQIRKYLEKKADGQKMGGRLREMLDGHTGLLINERVINMPPQVVAPMLRMLAEETQRATEAGEPFDFEYYLLLAPMYREVSEEENPRRTEAMAAFAHAEDEFVEEFACFKFDYRFSRSQRVADARNSFADSGLAPSRRCLVIPRANFASLIKRLEEVLAP
ncbi:Mss4p nuclear export [Coemansia guatemalensis]|uniref:Protein BCP1 n=1 Tax=Coemansia guatemalensis TaxID=2761395 RepID=A0A9W8LVG5_9FUNG|nr:Mss4p nuclear export [Coemansia guatemalensis]